MKPIIYQNIYTNALISENDYSFLSDAQKAQFKIYVQSEPLAVPMDKESEDEELQKEIVANNLYNISNESGHHLLDTMKCDEIAEFILQELKSQFTIKKITNE